MVVTVIMPMAVVVTMSGAVVVRASLRNSGLRVFDMPMPGVIERVGQQMQYGVAEHRTGSQANEQVGRFLEPGLAQRETGDTDQRDDTDDNRTSECVQGNFSHVLDP